MMSLAGCLPRGPACILDTLADLPARAACLLGLPLGFQVRVADGLTRALLRPPLAHLEPVAQLLTETHKRTSSGRSFVLHSFPGNRKPCGCPVSSWPASPGA